MTPARAPLIEIFHSIQGEGRFVGEPMGFVRVATCPLRCRYCDTPASWTATASFPVHGLPSTERNPCTAARAVDLALECASVSKFRGAGPLRISLTGGEPLVHARFVREFGELLGERGQVHLETAAHDSEALRECLPAVAHVSADWKLAGTLESGDFSAQHRACVALVAQDRRTSLDVKLVLTPAVTLAAFDAALRELAPFREALWLILQPVTPHRHVPASVSSAFLGDCAALAGEREFRYRVLAQLHPVLGVR